MTQAMPPLVKLGTFSLPKFTSTIFDAIGYPGSEEQNKYLIKCAITRFWCNILFFPINLISFPENFHLDLWCSYFLCRGSMDWITFKLLSDGHWAATYKQRFSLFEKNYENKNARTALLEKCYDVRTGNRIVKYVTIISDVIELAIFECNRFGKDATPSQLIELQLHVSGVGLHDGK